jgi:hypothetical protein
MRQEQVLGNYKNLLAVEDAFCQLKSYMEVRPVFHWRPDRVRNHVRLCFIAYWLCAKLAHEWRLKGEKGEVQRLLRRLQAIRVGSLKIADQDAKRLLTQILKSHPSSIRCWISSVCFRSSPHRQPGLKRSPKKSGCASSHPYRRRSAHDRRRTNPMRFLMNTLLAHPNRA